MFPFRAIALAAFLAVTGHAATAEAKAPPAARMVRLAPAGEGGACTADGRWCVTLAPPGGDDPRVPVVQAGGAPGRAVSGAPSDESDAVWPVLIVLPDGGFLAGVRHKVSTAYSGGGGSATELRLFQVTAGEVPGAGPVLSLPLEVSLLIRACFGEREMRRRRGACHDEYRFGGRIALAPGSAAGRPILTYATEASAFPRGVSRSRDSNTMPALGAGDLAWQRDPACSFVRRFRFDPASGRYQPDRPLPECSDYTIP